MLEFKHDLLPSWCYVFVETQPAGQRVRKAKLGLSGHWGNGYHYGDLPSLNLKADQVRAIVRQLNRELGVTALEEDCMQAGTCFGWDVPAADPAYILGKEHEWEMYTEGGTERIEQVPA